MKFIFTTLNLLKPSLSQCFHEGEQWEAKMALSRLLVLKSPLRLHFHLRGETHFTKRRLDATIRVKERETFMGFDKNLLNTISELPKSTRWHSSSSYDPPSISKEKLKPSETAMEQEAKTVKADSKK